MQAQAALSLFLVGLLGGVHCVGMCGGIVGALSIHDPTSRGGRFAQHLAYNAGRIGSYVAAGAVVGAIGQASLFLAGRPLAPFHYLLANLMLMALGFYMLGVTRFLTPLERAGSRLWKSLHPLSRHLFPPRTAPQSFVVGLIWGWLPCGLVYSALATALSVGSVSGGAYAMLAFGIGTLPNMLLAGMMATRLRSFIQKPVVRYAAGSAVLLFGLYGGLRALQKIIG